MSKLEFGKTYYPPKPEITVTDNLVKGPGWKVERFGTEFIFEFLAARHGGGVDRYKVTAEEFEELKLGRLSFEELLKKYDVN
ncbi:MULTISPECIES: hypothetical protein [Thalassospira]|uniref:Uncharacterized protein n=2 Tax=Thalassospira TaxID=168934 RepID=A0AB72UC66_9PROT|nr:MULTISPECIES: hypothetical protein [Thalassospira]AJD51758.1 hypothetical protein TH3_08200 [Thalassospira xiamenensis M-5 = DSM 17429]AXO14572.1 hypothetical protein DY252_10355 [Thalassospira indica]OAZ10005.1 hypothetical protein TH15_19515 [Thalassospira profundimaris]SIT00958.1 hypothetical protein SAMN02744133_104205 [Thalassospira xiamenensis M-5 = DSM 17429]